uniref:Uncharacterized protein n=1 Tax=Tanacetum cinerariifolium TaxID=118510 RepID=A0A6L2MEA2_TANCI|nr:hypothetical protein [Tanacetum cinerariifolium]
MILESVEQAIQADCDVKATNIILQGLPPEGESFTQGTILSIPIGGSISPEGFLLPILLLVMIMVMVVIVVVILVVFVVAIFGVVIVVTIIEVVVVVTIIGVVVVIGVFAIIKLSPGDLVGLLYSNRFGIGIPPGQGILDESTSRKFHFAVLGTGATRKYQFSSFKPMNETNSFFRTIEVERLSAHKLLDTMEILEFKTSKNRYGDNRMSDSIGGFMFLVKKVGENQMSSSGVIDLTGNEDPTDEDGDTGMDDSTRVSVSLGGEISSRGKKSQESNSDNTGGTKVGEAIGACSGRICNSSVASYACMTSIYGSSCKGEKTSVAKRYLVKSFEESGEVFPGEAGKQFREVGI